MRYKRILKDQGHRGAARPATRTDQVHQGSRGRRHAHDLETRPAQPSLRDLIGLLDDLKARGVAFRSLTEAIDTTAPTGRALWQMVEILAELEHSLIQERTQAGRAAAVARGVKMGRKPLLSPPQVAHARKLIEQGKHHDTVGINRAKGG